MYNLVPGEIKGPGTTLPPPSPPSLVSLPSNLHTTKNVTKTLFKKFDKRSWWKVSSYQSFQTSDITSPILFIKPPYFWPKNGDFKGRRGILWIFFRKKIPLFLFKGLKDHLHKSSQTPSIERLKKNLLCVACLDSISHTGLEALTNWSPVMTTMTAVRAKIKIKLEEASRFPLIAHSNHRPC